MARRVGNDVLLALVLLLVLSGVLGWALPISSAGWLYDAHRALGVAVVAAIVLWKWRIAFGSLGKRVRWRRRGTARPLAAETAAGAVVAGPAAEARRAAGAGVPRLGAAPRRLVFDRSVLWGVLPGVALLLGLAIGLAWTLGLIGPDLLWGYSPLNVHVFVGIGLVPFVAAHMLVRRRQNAISAPAWSRRTLLTTGAAGVAALVGWQAIERLTPAVRLISGSKAIGSFNANAFPAEIWLFDSVPLLDTASWRLSVLGRDLTLDALTRAHAEKTVRAVLDCTSGWWSEQDWTGVALSDVLARAFAEQSGDTRQASALAGAADARAEEPGTGRLPTAEGRVPQPGDGQRQASALAGAADSRAEDAGAGRLPTAEGGVQLSGVGQRQANEDGGPSGAGQTPAVAEARAVVRSPSTAVGAQVVVTSVTGHRIVLDPDDVQKALLATHVGGEVLSPGHGYPLRLVVPDRRGYYWVKWVAAIDAA